MSGSYPGNFAYLQDNLGILPGRNHEQFESCLVAMSKYLTPWWYNLQNFPAHLAAMQFKEPVLLITSYKFRKGIEEVLGRQLKGHELISQKNHALREEFDAKYKEYQEKESLQM
ncbi:MAG: hypothetical protein J6C46_01215 [Clostridia bacterium]|nr:hypothetical protein [Clostridia bacterium]